MVRLEELLLGARLLLTALLDSEDWLLLVALLLLLLAVRLLLEVATWLLAARLLLEIATWLLEEFWLLLLPPPSLQAVSKNIKTAAVNVNLALHKSLKLVKFLQGGVKRVCIMVTSKKL